jgi:hypothetical protein
MSAPPLPPEVEAVLRQFYTCEFTTVNKEKQPITWPTVPFYRAEDGRLIVATSIAFPIKAYNARRYPKVSLLFSDTTGCDLPDPPAVLVQGTARHVDELLDIPDWSIDLLRQTLQRQPAGRAFLKSRLAQKLFTFYFQRIAIEIEAERIWVWPHRDFSQPPQAVTLPVEAPHVE